VPLIILPNIYVIQHMWTCLGGGEEGRRGTDTDGEHHQGKPTDAVSARQTG